MNRLVAGTLAGLVATVPMSAVMLAGHRLLERRLDPALPPEQIVIHLSAEAGSDAHHHPPVRRGLTTALHFAFGGATGAVYGDTANRLPIPPGVSGVGFALLTWLVSYQGWIPATGILPPATDQPGRRNALMIGAHIVWGAALGRLTERLTRP